MMNIIGRSSSWFVNCSISSTRWWSQCFDGYQHQHKRWNQQYWTQWIWYSNNWFVFCAHELGKCRRMHQAFSWCLTRQSNKREQPIYSTITKVNWISLEPYWQCYQADDTVSPVRTIQENLMRHLWWSCGYSLQLLSRRCQRLVLLWYGSLVAPTYSFCAVFWLFDEHKICCSQSCWCFNTL